jgi:Trichodiene synthase (TRI5)
MQPSESPSDANVPPDLIVYCSDVLSFYKEDLDGETVNLIGATALSRNISKLDVLKGRAQRAKNCYDVVMKVLAPHPEALKAWRSFAQGFCYFHTSSPRYKLGEMFDVSEHDLVCQCDQCTGLR